MTGPSTPVAAQSRAELPGGGGWVRILLGVACALTMVALYVPKQAGGQVFLQWLLMVGIGLWVVMRPGSGGPVLLLIGALCVRIFLGKAQLDGQLIGLVLLLPLVHQLSALAAVIPLRGPVQWAALLPSMLRYLGAVLATVGGLLASHWLGWW
jgi:hypothetical protein